MAGRSQSIRKVGFTLRSSLSWIRPMAAAVIAYAVLGWTEIWQWGGIFVVTYLMELTAVYLSLPTGSIDDDYEDDSGSGSGSGSGRKMPKMKKKF
ncbi:MAG: hypothetical protein VX942_04550 [Candidatus Thermoplasmatota archaeon]|nr:hypothetical protein [Candidatus Thermoplasmatota archaeon]